MTLEDKINKIDVLKAKINAFGKIPIDILQKINYKFRLEWNYHSNKMEGGTLTKDETRNVMLGVVDMQGKPLKDVFEMSGHDNVVLDVLTNMQKMAKNELNISEKRILELHKAIMYEETPENQSKIGKWKTENNEIINYKGEKFPFVPVSEVKEAMHDLTNWLNTEIDKIESNQKTVLNPTLHAALLAFEFHLRYVNIHPFYDGNGRTARIFMNIILIAFGYPPIIIKADKRDVYFRYLADVCSYSGDKNLYFGFMLDLLYTFLELVSDAIQGKNIDYDDDLDKKIGLLKNKLQVEEPRNTILDGITTVIWNLVLDNSPHTFFYEIGKITNKFKAFFVENSVCFIANNRRFEYVERDELVIESLKNSIGKMRLLFEFKGFKKTETEAFDVNICIIFSFKDFAYNITLEDNNHIIKKLYHQLPTSNEIETFAKIIGNAIYDEIEQKLTQAK